MSTMAGGAADFRPFRLRELLQGHKVYEFAEFYEVKALLLRYDERHDYLNYGYWADGAGTSNPSAALVEHVGRSIALGADDVVLDIGSGLGEPALDLVRRFDVKRVHGINLQAKQVELANSRAKAAGMADVVMHHVGDACSLGLLAPEVRPTAAISVEVLAEVADVDEVLHQAHALLEPGGRIAFCDIVLTSDAERLVERLLGRGLTWTTATLYGDAWRTEERYRVGLERAGFVDVQIERIGSKTYAPTYAHARTRMRDLRGRGLPRLATAFAYANLRLLDLLHAAGRIDYSVFSARVPS